jgi:hypothetical protein
MTQAKNAEIDEPTIKRQIVYVLEPYFDLRTEVKGRHPWHKSQPRIDFWCYPKEKALALRWPAEWFGIEAKSMGLQDQHGKAALRLSHQAEQYRESEFPVGDEWRRPYFVLVCPTFAQIVRHNDYSLNPEHNPLWDDGFAVALGRHAGMSRVGELLLTMKGFEVYFHSKNCQFSTQWGWTRVDYLGAETDRASR